MPFGVADNLGRVERRGAIRTYPAGLRVITSAFSPIVTRNCIGLSVNKKGVTTYDLTNKADLS